MAAQRRPKPDADLLIIGGSAGGDIFVEMSRIASTPENSGNFFIGIIAKIISEIPPKATRTHQALQ